MTSPSITITETTPETLSGTIDGHRFTVDRTARTIQLGEFFSGELLPGEWSTQAVFRTWEELTGSETVSIPEAAAELGLSPEQFVDQLVTDGLVIDLDGELVPLPHPDLVPLEA